MGYFCGLFLPSCIRIRIQNPDPLTLLNPDPIRIRIQKTLQFSTHLIELEGHLDILGLARVLAPHLHMVGVHDLPLEVQALHGAVHLAHDVVGLALRANAQVPLGALDRRAPVCLLHLKMCTFWYQCWEPDQEPDPHVLGPPGSGSGRICQEVQIRILPFSQKCAERNEHKILEKC